MHCWLVLPASCISPAGAAGLGARKSNSPARTSSTLRPAGARATTVRGLDLPKALLTPTRLVLVLPRREAIVPASCKMLEQVDSTKQDRRRFVSQFVLGWQSVKRRNGKCLL
eukprot:GHRQ01036261.1.p4 GENE.GHRQ01036261.1~~GHRQ01036261.1.p4  ORF type:complete len:112 (-),score=7.87 GHRQ01036261.1:833-1168(-)